MAKTRPPRTLSQMAVDAASGPSGIECPSCGCRDFRTYGHGPSRSFRYKSCRHCGVKVLTASTERIVREVVREVVADDLDDVADDETMGDYE